MAATKANLVQYPGGQDVWGGHGVKFMLYTGPALYSNPGGDQVDCVGVANQTGLRSIGMIASCMSTSGNYWIVGQPKTAPSPGAPVTWFLRWFAITAGVPTEVANTTVLSGETATLVIVEG
jgi:hypothetical protein